MRSLYGHAALLLFALCLAGCSQPIPPERMDYVGEWRAADMTLVINPDGSVHYRRKSGSTTTEINAPLKAFKGDDFIVGVAVFTTTFTVSTPPHAAGGVWKMVVDGVELTRGARAAPGPRQMI